MNPTVLGIHHVKLAVSDLNSSLSFFERCFGATRIPEADHRHQKDGSLYAYILHLPGVPAMLELRLNPQQAARNRLFDPITFAVQGRADLERWGAHMDDNGVRRSKILTGVKGWVIVFEDPDQNRLRLYTLDTHGPELAIDEADIWLQGQ